MKKAFALTLLLILALVALAARRQSAITVPQQCSQGMFVTGIDKSGQLVCSAPGTGQ